MSEVRAFEPMYSPTGPSGGTGVATPQGTLQPSVTLAATAASSASAVFPGSIPSYKQQIQIANQATVWAFVNFGVFGNIAAATVAASYPVAPGAVVVVTVDKEVSGATVILASGTGNVTFTRGEGL
jgi:glucose/arabinose dehydrogenase